MRILQYDKHKMIRGIFFGLSCITLILMIIVMIFKPAGLFMVREEVRSQAQGDSASAFLDDMQQAVPKSADVSSMADLLSIRLDTNVVFQIMFIVIVLLIVMIILLAYDDLYWKKLFHMADYKYEEQGRFIKKIPIGIAIFKLENRQLHQLYVNENLYEMLQTTEMEWRECFGDQILNGLFEEDQEVLEQMINDALGGNNSLEILVRISLINRMNYKWIRMSGKVISRSPECLELSFGFHDMDEVQLAKQRMESAKHLVGIAMENADMVLSEYFPDESMMLNGYGRERWNLPKYMENFPNSWFDMHITHPEDEGILREAFRQIDLGEDSIVCDVRNLIDIDERKYYWCRVKLIAAPHQGQECRKIVCLCSNIDEQKKEEEAYKKHLDMILRTNSDAVGTFRLNLTKNICESGYSRYQEVMRLYYSSSINDFFKKAAHLIPYTEEKLEFIRIFNRQHLIEEYHKGNNKIELEHHAMVEQGRKDWIITVVEMLLHPETAELEAVVYEENRNVDRIRDQVIHAIMKIEYEVICYVDCRTQSYYTFHNIDGKLSKEECKEEFFKQAMEYLKANVADVESYDKIELLSEDRVIRNLEEKEELDYYFMLKQGKEGIRKKKFQISYIDRESNKIIIMMQDITEK